MGNYDVVIVGQQPWDTEIGSNCKNIALELSKRHRVLYVNSPLDRATLLRNRRDSKVAKRLRVIRGMSEGLKRVSENLWTLYPNCIVESINWLPLSSLFDYVNKINNRRLAKSIRSAISVLGFRDILLFNDNEIFKAFYLNEFLNPKQSIYYSRDYMIGVPYWKRHGERLEPLLIAKNSICFTNSLYLRDYCAKYNTNTYYVGQGCEIDQLQHYDPTSIPYDMAGINVPILGYVGALDSNRLDIGLMERLADAFPQYMMVLVGPEDDAVKHSELHRKENVVFLGKKPVDELFQYIGAFSVCINPQLTNSITIGNYPRKIDEYLALGKPVVATHNPTMLAFSPVVYLANTPEEYVLSIRKALAENTSELEAARKAFVASHTWENSVAEMLKHLQTELDNTTKKMEI